MQFDFHYCALRVLAYQAGFSPEQAQIIAYASQFVDDATEHEPIEVRHLPEIEGLRLDRPGWIDPICTANYNPRQLVLPSLDMQRKVYIPFHFFPAGQGEGFLVEADSKRAQNLVLIAVEKLQDAIIEAHRKRALIALGIALHTFADTWAHDGFSGRNCQPENDLAALDIWQPEEGCYRKFQPHYSKIVDMFSFIGHVQAGVLPDQSGKVWRYQYAASGETVERSNPDDFLAAAKHIFDILCHAAGTIEEIPQRWKEIEDRLFCLFSFEDRLPFFFSRDRALRRWRHEFPGIRFEYDREQWRNAAVQNDIFAGDGKWLFFHAEAHAQREWVLSQIPYDLM
jgi:hypothetical protein